MSYKNLEVWQLARVISIEIHKLTLNQLPKFEMYEVGSQIRRSSKSIRSNIVEGYGRKKYQQEYLKHLVYALGSNDETIDHLETLYETGSLQNKEIYNQLHGQLELLGKKLRNLINTIERDLLIEKQKSLEARSKQPEAETKNKS